MLSLEKKSTDFVSINIAHLDYRFDSTSLMCMLHNYLVSYEKNLFLKIINAICVSKNESFFSFENEKELEKSIQYDNAIAILNFTNRIIQVSDPLISVPPLKSLLNEPSLKSELWQKIKHLRE